MTVTPKRFIEGSLITNAVTTLYTVPANQAAVIKKLTLTNTDTGQVTVTIYLVRVGDTAAARYKLIDTHTMNAHETYDCYEALWHVLQAGDMLQAIASTTNVVNIIASGVLVG